jgi:hypothetical protein
MSGGPTTIYLGGRPAGAGPGVEVAPRGVVLGPDDPPLEAISFGAGERWPTPGHGPTRRWRAPRPP